MIGKQILHYKIIKKLGAGGMGVVYLAEDTNLDRHVALKFLPHQISDTPDERQRFEIEAKAAAALNHPNIATIHAIQQHENELFIVMEYIEGQELKERIKSDPLSAYHRYCMGNAYIKKQEFNLAERSIKKAQELAPESPLIYFTLGFLRERQDSLEEAILTWQKAVLYSNRLPQNLGVLGYGYGKLGQTDKALEILEELQLKSRDGYVAAMDIAKVYAGLGDADRAFTMLEGAYTNREPWIFGLKLDPGFDPIRNDPRFISLLNRIGVKP